MVYFNNNEMMKKIVQKLLSPHLMLVIGCIIYMIIGAIAFRFLEEQNLKELKLEQLKKIDLSAEVYANQLRELVTSKEFESYRHIELKRIIRAKSRPQFDNFVDTVFAAHRTIRRGYEADSPSWDFINSFFFTATMLTSIGYGFIVPFTFYGRLFVVIYCLIGIPLTLVTVANVAKFISESIFFIHYKLWRLWMRFRYRSSNSDDGSALNFSENEDEQEILERVKLVRFPPIVVFLFVFIYGLLGSYIIQMNECWTYSESMYFTFISILTVGFGDYRPEPKNLLIVLPVLIGGIILTTMCMDVVGRMYLKEIHYLGRKLKTNNPFYLIREAKTRRRRQAMASVLAQLARGMIFAHRNFAPEKHTLREKRKKKYQHYGSHLLSDGKFMFARLPPDPPSDCQVVSTSAYSVRLAWAPAFSTDDQVTYNIRYRLKHKEGSKYRELKGIPGNTAEIMSVDSCSLYEFCITAVSRYGESKSVYLVQYTEPQLSPQHILATRVNANTIELKWEPPYKRTHDVTEYIVYYTDNPNAPLSDWEKVTVHGRHFLFPDLRFDWFYMFCATACFNDGQRSPLSRALFIKTDKLEFNRQFVGQSRTVEVMNSICDTDESNEVMPLMKRDYISFNDQFMAY